VHMTFIVYRDVPTLNSLKIPQAEDVKYLELHLDHRLNWKKTYTYQVETPRILIEQM